MNGPERQIAHPGPRFARVDGRVMFSFVIDPSNIIGPRPATKKDAEQYAAEWGQFVESEPVPEPTPVETFNGADPAKFDHDGDRKPGGTLPGARVTAAPAKAKRPYTRRKAR